MSIRRLQSGYFLQIWSCHARHIQSEDHNGDEGKRSNTSTLRSNDSGHATMDNGSPNASKANSDCLYFPSSEADNTELRKKESSVPSSSQYKNQKYLPRPMTVGGIPSSLPSPEYINMETECSSYAAPQQAYEKTDVSKTTEIKAQPKDGQDKKDELGSLGKSNPEYLNMSFEQSVIPSKQNLSNPSAQEQKNNTRGMYHI